MKLLSILLLLLSVFSFGTNQTAISLTPEADLDPGTASDDFYVFGVGDYYLPIGSNDHTAVNFPTVVTPPSHGTVQFLGQQGINFGFGADPTYTGSDSFTYKVCGPINQNGDTGCTNVATVTLLLIGSDDSQNYGACQMKRPVSPAPNSVGKPINVTNGNMWLQQTDYSLPGVGEALEIDRFYNSKTQANGIFGLGWTTKYDESLTIYDDRMLRLDLPDAKGIYFGRKNTTSAFTAVSPGLTAGIEKHPDNSYSLTFEDGRIHKFSNTGTLEWQQDHSGNQTSLTYNQSGQLASITDSAGRMLTLTPDQNGLITQISDLTGFVADYEYFPGTSSLKTVTYPDGSKYKFDYTTVGAKTLLTTVKDALDNILEAHSYDSQGRAITSEKHGGVEKYTLNFAQSTQTEVTDARGKITKYSFYRQFGSNLVNVTEGVCGCGGSGSEVTQYYYDAQLNLTTRIDALGRQTIYNYDASRNVVQMTDPLGTQKWTYNSKGQISTYQDRVDQSTPNNTVMNTYDLAGNLLTSTDRLGYVTTMTYSTAGRLETITDARGKTTTFSYDAQGRLTEIIDTDNKITTFGYDARARLTSLTNAKNETTTFEYDLNNRSKKVVYPDGNYIEHTYDLAGRKTATRDPRGYSTIYGYDNAYRLTSVADPLTHTRSFGYDLMSNMTAQTDGVGNTTNFEYDDFNRPKKVIYPPAVTGATRLEESLTYDKVGNVKTRVDTAGRTTSYLYDNSNRLTWITDALNQATNFQYNARSQMTKLKDALNREYVFTYDPLGRKLSETRAGTTMSYLYDEVGNRKKRTDHNGAVTDYGYDDLNRLTTKTYQGTVDSTFTYDELSRILTATNAAGTVSFTYDNRGRIDTTTDVYGKTLDYDYDAAGNRTLMKLDGANLTGYSYNNDGRLSMLTNHVSFGLTYFFYDTAERLTKRQYPYTVGVRNRVETTHKFDGMSRLTRTTDKRDFTTLFDRQYSYNNAGQISQIVEPSRSRTYAYDDVDRLTSVTDTVNGNESYSYDAVGNRANSHLSGTYTYGPFNRLTGTASATYAYDNNGAMTSRTDSGGTMSFAYDPEGRLLTAQNSLSQLNEYKYDALGRRVFTNDPSQPQVKYVYDGQDVVLTDRAGNLTKHQNGPGIDNKLGMNVAGAAWPQYFLSDHLGTTTGAVTPNGTFTPRSAVDAFGNGSSDFTGREYDSFTGNTYYRARMYDPQLGRFISEDPIGFAGGDVNLYGYVHSNPVNKRDPFGLVDLGWGSPTGPKIPYSHLPKSDPCGCTPPGTFQIGLAGSGVLGIVPLTGGGGVAVDTSGNIGVYYEYGTGAGIGLNATGGLQLSATNASNIQSLGGIFVNPTASLGGGPAASGSLIFGLEDSGPITGASLLLGGGGGAEASVTVTNTIVVPLFKLPFSGGKICAR